jgi:hypothetical protein
MNVEGFLNIYNSKADIYGNRYWACELVRESPTGSIQTHGTIGCDNVNTIDCRENMKWVIYREELPIRQFNRLTKKWKHIGTDWEEIKANLMKGE